MVKPCFLHALFIAAYMSLFIFSSHLQSALMISLPKKKIRFFFPSSARVFPLLRLSHHPSSQ